MTDTSTAAPFPVSVSSAVSKLGSKPVAALGIGVRPAILPSRPTGRNAIGSARSPDPTNQRT